MAIFPVEVHIDPGIFQGVLVDIRTEVVQDPLAPVAVDADWQGSLVLVD